MALLERKAVQLNAANVEVRQAGALPQRVQLLDSAVCSQPHASQLAQACGQA